MGELQQNKMLNMAYHPKHTYAEGCQGAVCWVTVGLVNNVACTCTQPCTPTKLNPFTFNNSCCEMNELLL